MAIDLIQVPYDSGHRGVRMGRGPLHFTEHGAADRLRTSGHRVSDSFIDAPASFHAEVATSFALYRALASGVRAAATRGAFPLVLSGNCGSALGTVSGLRSATPNDNSAVGVIWLDAHGDFNTPETTASGFLDGMALAALTGRCWQALTASIPGFRPVPDAHVVLVGARDLDAAEERALGASGVMRIGAERVRVDGVASALDEALTALAGRVSRVYLHIDLDVHDPAGAQANHFAVPGGLSAAAVRDLVRVVAERFTIAAAALTAYDPACDPDNRMLEVGLQLMTDIADRCR